MFLNPMFIVLELAKNESSALSTPSLGRGLPL